MIPLGWLALWDGELWQPALQLDGLLIDCDIWFDNELECLEFIHDQIIGREVLP